MRRFFFGDLLKVKLPPKVITKKSVDYFARRLLRVPCLYHNKVEEKTIERQFETFPAC